MKPLSIRGVVVTAVFTLCAAMLGSAQSEYPGTRDLVARVQNDLQRAADFAHSGDAIKVKKDEKQIERYRNAQHRASNLDRNLSRGKLHKGDLDRMINDLKNVVEHNTLQSQDRDALTNDLRDLRELRARD